MSETGPRELGLLEAIERNPDATQASMATRLGVAVGTVNWHLKRLVAKGYIKVRRAERRKLRYIITPKGISLRARLTVRYVETSLALYRETRRKAQEALRAARIRGYRTIRIRGNGDLADICRLTGLEQGFRIASDGTERAAILEIEGKRISLRLPESGGRA